ncbi:hypothetical protein ERHA54_24680 [Erwinia rhapontici]|nr:hypothetical protein ERHA54_24680 [Erwinia rhapontici]
MINFSILIYKKMCASRIFMVITIEGALGCGAMRLVDNNAVNPIQIVTLYRFKDFSFNSVVKNVALLIHIHIIFPYWMLDRGIGFNIVSYRHNSHFFTFCILW